MGAIYYVAWRLGCEDPDLIAALRPDLQDAVDSEAVIALLASNPTSLDLPCLQTAAPLGTAGLSV